MAIQRSKKAIKKIRLMLGKVTIGAGQPSTTCNRLKFLPTFDVGLLICAIWPEFPTPILYFLVFS
jgi:hypothetical protein